MLYVPKAQGSLPQGGHYCTSGVRIPASGVPHVPHVPRTVAPQVLGRIALSLFMSPRPPPSRATQRSVALLSLVFVVSVGSGNAALRYIHISFAQSIGATAPL